MIFVFTIGSLYWSQHPINRETGYSNVLTWCLLHKWAAGIFKVEWELLHKCHRILKHANMTFEKGSKKIQVKTFEWKANSSPLENNVRTRGMTRKYQRLAFTISHNIALWKKKSNCQTKTVTSKLNPCFSRGLDTLHLKSHLYLFFLHLNSMLILSLIRN